jgi:hypothetical protein
MSRTPSLALELLEGDGFALEQRVVGGQPHPPRSPQQGAGFQGLLVHARDVQDRHVEFAANEQVLDVAPPVLYQRDLHPRKDPLEAVE